MKRLLLIVTVVSAVSLILSASAVFAIAPNDLPRFALHIKTVTKLGALCTTQPHNNIDCVSFNIHYWPLYTPGYAYVVVGQAPAAGVEGASFGITYNPSAHSLGYVSWTQCGGGLTFPNDGGNGDFPQPDGGVRMTNYPCSANNTGPKRRPESPRGDLYVCLRQRRHVDHGKPEPGVRG